MDLVEVPAGRVRLADRRTERSWTVEVAGFALGSVPVTRALYAEVTGAALPEEGRCR
ncbi:hypothetical protein GCM10029992_44730 [Glycomyces albus]